MYRILIIEDDCAIAETMQRQIALWGYEVRCVENFKDVRPEFMAFDPQLVLLDLMLPYFNGYHWCSEIRKVSRVPIVFLSSASDNMNIVMAMNMGGDDFIAKPFDLNVLTAKLQAILRRTYDFGNAEQVLECRGAVLNTSDASRDTLMQRLWETDCFVDENTLTVNVTRLRRKLDGIGLQNFIVTRKGMGYLLVEE